MRFRSPLSSTVGISFPLLAVTAPAGVISTARQPSSTASTVASPGWEKAQPWPFSPIIASVCQTDNEEFTRLSSWLVRSTPQLWAWARSHSTSTSHPVDSQPQPLPPGQNPGGDAGQHIEGLAAGEVPHQRVPQGQLQIAAQVGTLRQHQRPGAVLLQHLGGGLPGVGAPVRQAEGRHLPDVVPL